MASYIATYHISGADGSYDATAYVRGSSYRIDVRLDGATYEMGRYGSQYWRRTPSGEVRIIGADVQSDPLDRWPRAPFSGVRIPLPKREVDRDGAHVFTYVFVPDGWDISGYGGDAAVRLTSLHAQPVTDADVEIPHGQPVQFVLPPGGDAKLPAAFARDGEMTVPVEIDGARRLWHVDTGTTQILIDIGEAHRLGLHPKFGHVIIPELRVGDVVAHGLPAQAVDLFGDQIQGLLGNELFTGHIVHIDYATHTLELIDHRIWTPPASATKIDADFREGMPLVTCTVDGIAGSRFALDTGSYWIVLAQPFAQTVHAGDFHAVRAVQNRMQFLEGPVWAVLAVVPHFGIAGVDLPSVDAQIEAPNAENLDIPLDGIVGNNVLSAFEWWYDYDDGAIWAR